jgi:membrane-associated protease RseP (regulator of RpoE activity)
MTERDIENILKDTVKVDYAIHDGQAVFVKFRTPHLSQLLMNDIQQQLSRLGLKSEISSLSTQILDGETSDIVVLKIHMHGNGYRSQISPTGLPHEIAHPERSTRWQWLSHPSVNAVLFVLTVIVVFVTGAATILNREITDEWSWLTGLQFSVSLLAILSAHEFGHYFAAKYHKLDVTLPYFLPGILIPPLLGFGGTTLMPGTFGAFIKIKSPIQNKKQLMDVGAAGPIAGFVVCLAVLVYGFAAIPEKSYAYQFYDVNSIYDGHPVMHFGSSLLFTFLGHGLAGMRMPAMYDIVHYPFIFAGWFGLLVTALNLLPIGQLDGGHITYSLLGKKQSIIAYIAFGAILVVGLFWDVKSWIFWALLILLIIKIKHPPVMNEEEPLDPVRKIIGIISLIIFILCFIPMPIYEKILTR